MSGTQTIAETWGQTSATWTITGATAGDKTCPAVDECVMACVSTGAKVNDHYSCGNASDCYFNCEDKKCSSGATIDGAGADNLYITVGSKADSCLEGTTVVAPDNGHLWLSMDDNDVKVAFRSMVVQSGTNTGVISVHCNSIADVKDCDDMTVC